MKTKFKIHLRNCNMTYLNKADEKNTVISVEPLHLTNSKNLFKLSSSIYNPIMVKKVQT